METSSFSIAAMVDFSTQAVVPIQDQQPMADETSFIQSLIGSQENQTKRKRKHVSDTSRCSSLHESQYPVSRNSIHYAPDGSKCKVPTTLGEPSQEVPHAVQQMHDFAQQPGLLSNEGPNMESAAKMEAVGKRSLMLQRWKPLERGVFIKPCVLISGLLSYLLYRWTDREAICLVKCRLLLGIGDCRFSETFGKCQK